MIIHANQNVILPKGAVVQRAGTGEDMVISAAVTGTLLHGQDVFVLDDGSVRCHAGMYVRLLAGATVEGGLSIAGGETVFVQPYSAVFVAMAASTVAQVASKAVKLEPDSSWDAAIGTSLAVGSAVFVWKGLGR